jgi:hypothetical protein
LKEVSDRFAGWGDQKIAAFGSSYRMCFFRCRSGVWSGLEGGLDNCDLVVIVRVMVLIFF